MAITGTTETNIFISAFGDMDKRFLVLVGDNLEYTIKAKTNDKGDRVYHLFHSDGEQWNESIKGTLAFTMRDNGNVVKFKSPDKGFKLTNIEYYEMLYIRILTTLHATLEKNQPLPRVVEDGGCVITPK